MNVAMRMPAIVPTMRRAATDSAPIWPQGERYLKEKPTATGVSTARRPGATISRSAPRVTMSTHPA